MPILSTCKAGTLHTYLLFNLVTIPNLELETKNEKQVLLQNHNIFLKHADTKQKSLDLNPVSSKAKTLRFYYGRLPRQL